MAAPVLAPALVALCLAVGGEAASPLPDFADGAFVLRWHHSVEKTVWEEHWTATPQGLTLGQVRIQGSGAGMEPPPEARLVDGWFVYSGADRPPVAELSVPDSMFTGALELCNAPTPTTVGTTCLPLSLAARRKPDDLRPIRLMPCP